MMLTLITFIYGTVFGSFASVLIYRSTQTEHFDLSGRSYCPNCHHKLGPIDLVPIFSFLLYRGKCRYCHKKISFTYLGLELIMGLLFTFVLLWNQQLYGSALSFNLGIHVLYFLALTVLLVSLFYTDLLYGVLPDSLSLITLGIILVFNTLFLALGTISWHEVGFSLLAGLLLAGFFGGLYFFSKGKAMGDGDMRLGLLMGFILGWPLVLVGFVVSFLLGSVIALLLLSLKQKRFGQSVPLGPFLITGIFFSWFWGQQVLAWYLGLLY